MTILLTPRAVEVRHFHLFCGLGGGARGFNAGRAKVGHAEARFRCIGGIDSDPAAVRDFGRLAGVPGTVLDLFDREQYVAFHGHEPPADWREATPADLRAAAGGERPNILFTSPPCKGFSGLLSQQRSGEDRYQALNRLTIRGLMLALEAWSDDPPEFVLLENVPRIATRGRRLLDAIEALLRSHGYAVAETVHDCGELGGLGQSRKRFLLVARHAEKVPPFLYEPHRRPLRSVGEVVGGLALPGDPAAGPMHRVRELQWRTWVRLAFVEAGSDWRSLNRLRVDGGYLADFGIVPEREWFRTALGVHRWDAPSGVVTSEARPQNGAFSVADPRIEQSGEYGQLGVRSWAEPTGAVSGQSLVGGGRYAIADPRPGTTWAGKGKYRITPWSDPASTIIAASTTGNGGFAVADPRSGLRGQRDAYQTAGHYGVVPWTAPSGSVTASAGHDNGRFSVADPRCEAGADAAGEALPAADERLTCLIRSLDGTWHRPFTTLELAALQGLIEPGEELELFGSSDGSWRERIGNAVPAPTAAAIASVMGQTLLLAWAGETFVLGATPIWVRPIALALSVAQPEATA